MSILLILLNLCDSVSVNFLKSCVNFLKSVRYTLLVFFISILSWFEIQIAALFLQNLFDHNLFDQLSNRIFVIKLFHNHVTINSSSAFVHTIIYKWSRCDWSSIHLSFVVLNSNFGLFFAYQVFDNMSHLRFSEILFWF